MNFRADAGPVVVALALAVGIVAGERAGPGAATALLVVGACLAAVAFAVRRWPRVVLAALAFGCLGHTAMQRALDGLERSAISDITNGSEQVVVHGTVADDPDGTRFATSVTVRVASIARGGAAPVPLHRLVLVRASGTDANELRVVAMGDVVTISGRLEALDGYDARARWRHVVARVVDARLDAFGPPNALLARASNAVRSVVLRGTRALPPEQRALFAGFAFGDTRDITDDVVDAFRAAGLSHLLAVSGANVAFVLALVHPLLRRASLAVRLASGSMVVLVFASATRFEPSVLRASVMAVVTMAAMFVGRPVSSLRLLALAVIALLLADPFLVHSVGFALSVGASAGIALWSRRFARAIPGPAAVREPLAVTLAAQAGVAPVLFAVFGGVPAISPLANLLAVPAAEPLSVYGLVASLALSLLAPLRPLASLVHVPTVLLLRWVAAVARACARVPLTIDGRAALGFTAVVCFAAACWKTAGTLRPDGAGLDEGGAVPEVAPR